MNLEWREIDFEEGQFDRFVENWVLFAIRVNSQIWYVKQYMYVKYKMLHLKVKLLNVKC